MKKRMLVSLFIAAVLISAMAVPAVADEEQTVGASVTVTEVISITISDAPDPGIHFGSVAPDTTDNPDQDADDTTPSVSIDVASETNVNVDLQISGEDFSGSFLIGNAKYSTTYAGTKTAMTTTNTTFASGIEPGNSQDVWHWLDVPSGTTAGTYNSNFNYKAVQS